MSDVTSSVATSGGNLEHRVRVLHHITIVSILVSAGALTLAIVIALRVPAPAATPSKLDELTVGRLNVVEPDGTPRMIISSRARFPGSFVRNKEIMRPDRRTEAGILFVDDEGTENGGLVQSGQLDKDGKVAAVASLTFDRFRQDQMLQLLLLEQGDDARAGVVINDRPSYKAYSIDDLLQLSADLRRMSSAEREATGRQHEELGHWGYRRGYLGTEHGSSKLVLNDPKGRPRLILNVSEQGEPSIALLDESGQSVRTIDAHKP
jgi:hypothetical protein